MINSWIRLCSLLEICRKDNSLQACADVVSNGEARCPVILILRICVDVCDVVYFMFPLRSFVGLYPTMKVHRPGLRMRGFTTAHFLCSSQF